MVTERQARVLRRAFEPLYWNVEPRRGWDLAETGKEAGALGSCVRAGWLRRVEMERGPRNQRGHWFVLTLEGWEIVALSDSEKTKELNSYARALFVLDIVRCGDARMSNRNNMRRANHAAWRGVTRFAAELQKLLDDGLVFKSCCGYYVTPAGMQFLETFTEGNPDFFRLRPEKIEDAKVWMILAYNAEKYLQRRFFDGVGTVRGVCFVDDSDDSAIAMKVQWIDGSRDSEWIFDVRKGRRSAVRYLALGHLTNRRVFLKGTSERVRDLLVKEYLL